jgi:hypothetical protein
VVRHISVGQRREGATRGREGGRPRAGPATYLSKRGQTAIFADPEGAIFGVMKSASGDPPDYLAEPASGSGSSSLAGMRARRPHFMLAVARYDIIENTGASG